MQTLVLGAVSLRRGEKQGSIARSQYRGLLALLALNANILVTHDAAIAALWGGRPPSSARTQIHCGVHAIRGALRKLSASDMLVSSSCGYTLRIHPELVDASLFERKVIQSRAAAAAGEHCRATELLQDGLSLWHGPAFGDAAGAFVSSARHRLDQQRAGAVEDLIALELQAGRYSSIVDRFSGVVEEYPLRERLRAGVMLAQFRTGDKVAALENYRQFRTRLAQETGLDPGPQLRALEQAILRADSRLDLDLNSRQGTSPFGGLLNTARSACDCAAV